MEKDDEKKNLEKSLYEIIGNGSNTDDNENACKLYNLNYDDELAHINKQKVKDVLEKLRNNKKGVYEIKLSKNTFLGNIVNHLNKNDRKGNKKGMDMSVLDEKTKMNNLKGKRRNNFKQNVNQKRTKVKKRESFDEKFCKNWD